MVREITIILILFCLVCCSGIGGGAAAPSTLIAHYKMNEDTASDNDELVGGGDFATADWVGDDPHPTYWTVSGESRTHRQCNNIQHRA